MMSDMKPLVGKGLVQLGTLWITLAAIVLQTSAGDAPTRLLLAKSWDQSMDPRGWLISEKYDGVRAHWDGEQLWTRGGNEISAPDYFLKELPKGIELDGELWLGRGRFEDTVSVVRTQKPDERWREIRYMIFDAPKATGMFEQRMEFVRNVIPRTAKHLKRVPQTLCKGVEHLLARRDRIVESGGEGLMIRQPRSAYESGYSSTLLKVKPHSIGEAEVIGHKPGQGRYEGMMGSVRVKTSDGREFSIGSGFSKAERQSAPPIGSTVTYRYRGLTKNKLPRFPTFLRLNP